LGTEFCGQIKSAAASEIVEQYSLGKKPEGGPENTDETESDNATGPSTAELIMQRATELDDHLYSFTCKDADEASSSKSRQDLLTDRSLVSTDREPPCHLRDIRETEKNYRELYSLT
jgi:hypothetical protein